MKIFGIDIVADVDFIPQIISIDGWSGAVYMGKHEIGADESYKIIL